MVITTFMNILLLLICFFVGSIHCIDEWTLVLNINPSDGHDAGCKCIFLQPGDVFFYYVILYVIICYMAYHI